MLLHLRSNVMGSFPVSWVNLSLEAKYEWWRLVQILLSTLAFLSHLLVLNKVLSPYLNYEGRIYIEMRRNGKYVIYWEIACAVFSRWIVILMLEILLYNYYYITALIITNNNNDFLEIRAKNIKNCQNWSIMQIGFF